MIVLPCLSEADNGHASGVHANKLREARVVRRWHRLRHRTNSDHPPTAITSCAATAIRSEAPCNEGIDRFRGADCRLADVRLAGGANGDRCAVGAASGRLVVPRHRRPGATGPHTQRPSFQPGSSRGPWRNTHSLRSGKFARRRARSKLALVTSRTPSRTGMLGSDDRAWPGRSHSNSRPTRLRRYRRRKGASLFECDNNALRGRKSDAAPVRRQCRYCVEPAARTPIFLQ